jgi:hypothetical protein
MVVVDNPICRQQALKYVWQHFETQGSFYSNS